MGKYQSDTMQVTGGELLIGQLAPWVTWDIWHIFPLEILVGENRSENWVGISENVKVDSVKTTGPWALAFVFLGAV